jgi:hypothetical protein
METLIATIAIFGVCMGVMAIGLLKGRPVRKDCGLDPVTGERITDCVCAATGKTCENEGKAEAHACANRHDEHKVVPLREGY